MVDSFFTPSLFWQSVKGGFWISDHERQHTLPVWDVWLAALSSLKRWAEVCIEVCKKFRKKWCEKVNVKAQTLLTFYYHKSYSLRQIWLIIHFQLGYLLSFYEILLHKCQTKASKLTKKKKNFLQIILMIVCVSYPTLVGRKGRVNRVVDPRERKRGGCCVWPTMQSRLESNECTRYWRRSAWNLNWFNTGPCFTGSMLMKLHEWLHGLQRSLGPCD